MSIPRFVSLTRYRETALSVIFGFLKTDIYRSSVSFCSLSDLCCEDCDTIFRSFVTFICERRARKSKYNVAVNSSRQFLRQNTDTLSRGYE